MGRDRRYEESLVDSSVVGGLHVHAGSQCDPGPALGD